MATITITVPEDVDAADIADYVHHVAEQIEEGYTSGHYSQWRNWDSDGIEPS